MPRYPASATVPETPAQIPYNGDLLRAGPLQVDFQGCREKALGVACAGLVSNLHEESQYCLYGKDYDVMRRAVDNSGDVYAPGELIWPKRSSRAW